MPEYVFNGGDPRDYFPAAIGRVNPGDRRTFDSAPPDGNWALAPTLPAAPALNLSVTVPPFVPPVVRAATSPPS